MKDVRALVWEQAARAVADVLADRDLSLDARRAVGRVEAAIWLAARRDMSLPTDSMAEVREQRA